MSGNLAFSWSGRYESEYLPVRLLISIGLLIVHRFRNYASPLLSQAQGLAVLSQTSALLRPSKSRGWDDFTALYNKYPEHQKSMSIVYDLNEQVCNIYVQRARSGPNGPPLTDEVNQFRSTLDTFPSGPLSENVLTWPIFIAALESTTPEQQQYFTQRLLAHHSRSGFANILTGVEQLKWVWNNDNRTNWTQLLPDFEAFIV